MTTVAEGRGAAGVDSVMRPSRNDLFFFVDSNRLFRAVVCTEASLSFELGCDRIRDDDAIALVVVAEHLGREGVAASVTHTQL